MRRSLGVNLVEVLLVLAIASFLLFMGIRQYMSYRFDADVSLINYNVDTLFSSMSSYFQANCGGVDGVLSPLNESLPANYFNTPLVIDINTTLVGQHYLNASQIASVLLVQGGADRSSVFNGYKVRFVPTRVTRPAEPIASGQNDNTYYRYGDDQTTGWTIIWNPEIMVLPANPDQAASLRLLTNAVSCIAPDWTARGPCNPNGANALLFSHNISFTDHAGAGSTYWIMNPMVDQMRQQQMNYNPMTILSTGDQDNQFYYCGS